MPLMSRYAGNTNDTRGMPWNALWSRVRRPSRHKTVHALRIAAEGRDAKSLAALLDPLVAVVVESDDANHPEVRMVNGTFDAVPLLIHGMAAQKGLVVVEGTVSGQAGLFLRRRDDTAAVTIDFAGPLIAAVWIRLRRNREQ